MQLNNINSNQEQKNLDVILDKLDAEQLNQVIGGTSVSKIPGVHKFSNVTLKRGVIS
ncbi:hypothetical protein Nos7524_3416 [Nostoc sp. PCC 7524]|uniref:hypothetical protein n=1 Tax=Nostoc sp. (strain ATCC 29411 / PCC 7524) TaxID=28072 RepID=UPI00029F2727|nr:hypothetical protein [Nostoc sp. PCC 7524]AFY49209.1 hypothetical protein Nos7524_3416 [Nostoc sp. PCC 7524]